MTDAELQQHASLCDRIETLEDAARYALKWLDRPDRRAGDGDAAKRLRAALALPGTPPEPMT
jgi:hypothetical protein